MKFSCIKFRFFHSTSPKLIPYLKLMGIAVTGFYKKGSDSDPIGMYSGSFWFKLVRDNSSKVLLAHFEKVLHKVSKSIFLN